MRFIRIGLSCVCVFHGDADTTLLRDTDSRARQTSRHDKPRGLFSYQTAPSGQMPHGTRRDPEGRALSL